MKTIRDPRRMRFVRRVRLVRVMRVICVICVICLMAPVSALAAGLALTGAGTQAAPAATGKAPPASATPGAPSVAPAGALAGDGAAQELFEQVLRRLQGYKDFQARFVESSETRAGTAAARESGQVSFKRPDLWRWEYTEPERKVVLVRGKDAEMAIEGDPQVSRYDLGSGDGPAGIGSLLAGGPALSRAFTARLEPGVEPATPVLRLDPVSLSDDYEYLLLRVRRSDLAVLEVVIVDPGGNRLRFQFEDLHPDRGLSEAIFRFAAPAQGAGQEPSGAPRRP